jgi:hypothetical protein
LLCNKKSKNSSERVSFLKISTARRSRGGKIFRKNLNYQSPLGDGLGELYESDGGSDGDEYDSVGALTGASQDLVGSGFGAGVGMGFSHDVLDDSLLFCNECPAEAPSMAPEMFPPTT